MAQHDDKDLNRHLRLALSEIQMTRKHLDRALTGVETLRAAGERRAGRRDWLDLRAVQAVLAVTGWCVGHVLRITDPAPRRRPTFTGDRQPHPPQWS